MGGHYLPPCSPNLLLPCPLPGMQTSWPMCKRSGRPLPPCWFGHVPGGRSSAQRRQQSAPSSRPPRPQCALRAARCELRCTARLRRRRSWRRPRRGGGVGRAPQPVPVCAPPAQKRRAGRNLVGAQDALLAQQRDIAGAAGLQAAAPRRQAAHPPGLTPAPAARRSRPPLSIAFVPALPPRDCESA